MSELTDKMNLKSLGELSDEDQGKIKLSMLIESLDDIIGSFEQSDIDRRNKVNESLKTGNCYLDEDDVLMIHEDDSDRLIMFTKQNSLEWQLKHKRISEEKYRTLKGLVSRLDNVSGGLTFQSVTLSKKQLEFLIEQVGDHKGREFDVMRECHSHALLVNSTEEILKNAFLKAGQDELND